MDIKIGDRFTRFVVLSEGEPYYYPNGKGKRKVWNCVCDCGNAKSVREDHLKSGASKSCGCLAKEVVGDNNRTHGLTKTPLYKVWAGIKRRCLNPNEISYVYYSKIKNSICKEWLNNPVSFIEWANKNGYKKGLQVDRINNYLGYSPENCRFVTPRKNTLNRKVVWKNNKSGYTGVHFDKHNNTWVSKICIKGKDMKLGYTKTKEEAILIRNKYIVNNNLQKDYEVQEIRS